MTPSITLIKSNLFSTGGAEKYARLLADAFYQRGFEVTILTTGPTKGDLPYHFVSFPIQSRTSLGRLWEFETQVEAYLAKKKGDIILGLDRNRFQTHLRASSGVHRSYLEKRGLYEPFWKRCRHQINPLHRSILHMEKKGFEHADLKCLFTNSYLVRNEIASYYNVDPKKITVIHNGVEWEKWQDRFDQTFSTPSITSRPKNRLELLMIGNDFERKGLLPLLKGLQVLNDKEIHLTVVGRDYNRLAFEKKAQTLGLATHVSFVGEVIDVTPHLQRADCLAIPSYYDPFANVTVEALAMGLFVLSSKDNGGSEVLHKENGVIVSDLKEVDSMVEALQIAKKHPKTKESAQKIRQNIEHLDLSYKLPEYVDLCLSSIS